MATVNSIMKGFTKTIGKLNKLAKKLDEQCKAKLEQADKLEASAVDDATEAENAITISRKLEGLIGPTLSD